MLLVDIPAEIQICGGYIGLEQYPLEDMQFKSIGYDSYFKLFQIRPSAFGTIRDIYLK